MRAHTETVDLTRGESAHLSDIVHLDDSDCGKLVA